MAQVPLVSVIIPVFNRAAMIGDAVSSILAQTLGDFEIIVVDDGSTDNSAETALVSGDPRLRLIRLANNVGIPTARNRGLEAARGKYIAWLDSDDLARPLRLERQVTFLEERREIAMVGSCGGRKSLSGRRKGRVRVPLFSNNDIAAELLFRSPFIQSSIMGRADVLKAFPFRADFPVCEDLDVFIRIAAKHPVANMPETLVDRRLHSGQTVRTESGLIRDRKKALFREQLARLGVESGDDELDLHVTLGRNRGARRDRHFLERSETWLQLLVQANERCRAYDASSLGFIVGTIWAQACRASPDAYAARRFSMSPLSRGLFNRNARQWALAALPVATTSAPMDKRRSEGLDRPRTKVLVQIAASLALIFCGWTARSWLDSGPARSGFLQEADQAHDIFVASLPVSASGKSAPYGLLAERAGLPLPTLPGEWHIVSAALVPTKSGPALAISAITASGLPVTIFAERDARTTRTKPIIRAGDDELIASWTQDRADYAVAATTTRALLAATVNRIYGPPLSDRRPPVHV